MAYRVKTGRVSVETQVTEGGGRATVDFYQGALLPDDVPEEQVQHLLRMDHIAEHEQESEEDADRGPVDELVDLDKDALMTIAAEEEVTVDGRWGTSKIVEAIREHRAAQD